MLLAVLYRAIKRIEQSETETGRDIPVTETGRDIPVTETGRDIPVTETGRDISGNKDLVEYLASQWFLLKSVGHQLRKKIGGARKDELEDILEFNR